MSSKDPDLVTVGWAYSTTDAGLAMAMLRTGGIPVFAQSLHFLSVAWNHSQALGGIAIMVPAAEAGTAADMLAGFQGTSSRWRGLYYLLLAVVVFLWVGVPPPSNGFTPAVRPAPTAQAPKVSDL